MPGGSASGEGGRRESERDHDRIYDLRNQAIYQGIGHDSWTRTYDLAVGLYIYEWLLRYSLLCEPTLSGLAVAPSGA